MIQKKYLLIFTLLTLFCAVAQQSHFKNIDSLSAKSFDYLSARFSENLYNPVKSKIYLQSWLKKAKAENNDRQLALVYKSFILHADKKLRLAYADSMMVFAKRADDIELIGSSYMTKGIVYHDRKEHIKALDNYLMADKYISQIHSPYLAYKNKYGIAQIKYYLGYYDEAISLFRECIDYFKDENDLAYLNSLHCLGLCYIQTGNYEWCTLVNQMGIDEGRKWEIREMEFYFIHSEGINQSRKGNYKVAIQKINSSLHDVIKVKDFANESVAYFYLGNSHWMLNQKEKAIQYFKKVDEVFTKEHYIRPDLREGYERLIDYYKSKRDTQSCLYYINQLLKVDQLISQNYRYLLEKIVKEYDTKELIREKNEIENSMLITRIISTCLFILMAVAIFWLVHRNNKNKRHFEALMKQDTMKHDFKNDVYGYEVAETEPAEISTKFSTPDISYDIETAILKKLEKFESSRKYLEKDMNLNRMAVLLNTNTKYVTRIIAKHRGKGTIEYITDLKLDYIIHLLKTESKYRNYTHQALGEEVGFGSTQNFTRAFKARTGISPNYFIGKLKKSSEDDDLE